MNFVHIFAHHVSTHTSNSPLPDISPFDSIHEYHVFGLIAAITGVVAIFVYMYLSDARFEKQQEKVRRKK